MTCTFKNDARELHKTALKRESMCGERIPSDMSSVWFRLVSFSCDHVLLNPLVK